MKRKRALFNGTSARAFGYCENSLSLYLSRIFLFSSSSTVCIRQTEKDTAVKRRERTPEILILWPSFSPPHLTPSAFGNRAETIRYDLLGGFLLCVDALRVTAGDEVASGTDSVEEPAFCSEGDVLGV